VVGAAVAAALGFAGQADATTQTFLATADTYVHSSDPSSNRGTSLTLKADASPTLRSYVRFDVSGLSGTVTEATLQFRPKNTNSTGFNVHGVADNSWGETTTTWANAPAYVATPVAANVPVINDRWASADVTALVGGNGTFSFALTTTVTSEIRLASREGGSAYAPRLVVETSSGGTPLLAPVNISSPTISGVTQAGQLLTAAEGLWSGSPTAYAYDWRRCDSAGSACSTIAGATAKTYTLTSAGVNATVRVVVTGTNAVGSGSATSAQTAPVTAVASPPPW